MLFFFQIFNSNVSHVGKFYLNFLIKIRLLKIFNFFYSNVCLYLIKFFKILHFFGKVIFYIVQLYHTISLNVHF